MPRLPDGVEPYHPVQDYDLRVGVLREHETGEPVGHVLVESVVYWRRLSGRLWWRRWGQPNQTAIANVRLQGDFEEEFLQGDELKSAVDNWAGGRWVEIERDGGRRLYAVSWLTVEESVEVARDQLGMDVDEMRRRRKP